MSTRHDGRAVNQLRPISITRPFTSMAPGSVLLQAGRTIVLCTCSIDHKVPDWMAGKGRGWLTAEYNMLPSSTAPRKKRERDGKVDGRTTEIQRLIGRSLRSIVDLDALGEKTLMIDCEVLQADGGTRTASITGAYLALADGLNKIKDTLNPERPVLINSVAAISVGIVKGTAVLDLDYIEDVDAEVDMNVVMTGDGRYIEVQGTGEEATFDEHQLASLLSLAKHGIQELTARQKAELSK